MRLASIGLIAFLLASALPAAAASQGSRCDTARELMNNTRKRLSPGAAPAALAEATQNLRRATELCPGLADAYYFLSLIAGALNDKARADNWRARAEFYGSAALTNGESLYLDGGAVQPGSPPAGADPPRAATSAPVAAAVPVSPIVRRKLAVVAGISRFKDAKISALKYTSKDAAAVARR
jgi:hypothetical protein